MNTSNPIPDNIRPIVAIGTILPPFALVILAFLWAKLNSDTSVIVPYMAYTTLTLLPLLLNFYTCRRHKDTTLPGSGLAVAAVFWVLALLPLAGTMATLNNIDVQLALALPVVLIAGFYCSALAYLVSALVCAKFFRKPTAPTLPL